MMRVDVPENWSDAWRNRQLWRKWLLADASEIRTLARTTATHAGDRSDSDEPVLAALSALVAGDHAAATSILTDAVDTDRHGYRLTVLGDVHARQRDWPMALEYYEKAVAAAPADPVPRLARAFALAATGSAGTALAELRELVRQPEVTEVATPYLAVALLCRSTEVRPTSRDGEPMFSSADQVADCRSLMAETRSLAGLDNDTAAAVAALGDELDEADRWVWRTTSPASAGALMVTLLLSVLGVVVGVLWADLAIIVVSAAIGAGALFLAVIANRVPAWELRARQNLVHW
ncbi:MAG TPA: hypothetical protein VJX10_16155 [Pseudonocardiaceae bacterium]|nr:hypothetical protein [Pseudonocardiaceae bacterium]